MADDKTEQAASGKPSDRSNGALDPARQDRDRQVARDFRQMTQAERLQDKSTNPAAKQVAAMDAAIDQKYGRATPEAARMKAAAREAVAQTLERGGQVRAPRVREVEQRRDETRDQHRAAAEKTTKDLER
ncbi:hypothetical protein GS397_27510 (plasmid) [Sphingobium yanoikuyae]|jgi:hypothetical protein|uniref:Uncharacterized protein n=1 Tax=Sphingobium yanoikuyae TaxID=13690 RepID=A0A6P1GTY8_SPHYA|nr:hypothetical protein [Sphingobium yanoikuyae]QHD70851.1 hypothetical protein GS397_27510 [Sphingobium yanoikuyae]SCW93504.1 hypothetical protein SAMN02927924_04340 [Sphingobium faniae]|tara:strand:+ start:265 stop:654 length:390 start_codon:yes stop_codon:yes gene_type:complete